MEVKARGGWKNIASVVMPSRNELFAHTRRIYEHYSPPPPANPSLFYKFEYTARIFPRIFNFRPSSLAHPLARFCTFGAIFFLISLYMWEKKCHILWLCWYRIGKKKYSQKNRHHLKRRWKKDCEDIWAKRLILAENFFSWPSTASL